MATTTITNPIKLRQQRISLYYASPLKKYKAIPKGLSVAEPGTRLTNFKKFASLYFYQIINLGGVTRLAPTSKGYLAFQRYAQTSYGSAVIKEMITNTEKFKGFLIAQGTKNEARGGIGILTLPKNFPTKRNFPVGGQKIFDLAIIHHEMAHTQVYLTKTTGKATIEEERQAVIVAENPVRKIKGLEPRYTYFRKGTTINIITGIKKNKEMTISKYDPSILVDLTDKDALK